MTVTDPAAPVNPGPLFGPSAIRKRPGMFVGGTGPMGLAHLAFELVNEGLAGHLRRGVSHVAVRTGEQLVASYDVGLGPEWFASLTDYAAPPDDPEVHDGLNIGLGVVSALSSVFTVVSDHADRRFQQVFVQGLPVGGVVDVGPAGAGGTVLTAVPDTAIFGATVLPVAVLERRMRELAILFPGLALTLDGTSLPSFGGLAGWARHLVGGPVRREVSIREVVGDVVVEVTVAWGGTGPSVQHTWVNALQAEGAHELGLREGLAGTEERGRVAVMRLVAPRIRYVGRTGRQVETASLRAPIRDLVRRAVGGAASG